MIENTFLEDNYIDGSGDVLPAYSLYDLTRGAKGVFGDREMCVSCEEVFEPADDDGLMCASCCDGAGWDDNPGDAETMWEWQMIINRITIIIGLGKPWDEVENYLLALLEGDEA